MVGWGGGGWLSLLTLPSTVPLPPSPSSLPFALWSSFIDWESQEARSLALSASGPYRTWCNSLYSTPYSCSTWKKAPLLTRRHSLRRFRIDRSLVGFSHPHSKWASVVTQLVLSIDSVAVDEVFGRCVSPAHMLAHMQPATCPYLGPLSPVM